MNESDLDFAQWWWLDQERKRLARSKRIKASRRELAELLIYREALIRQLQSEREQRRRPVPQRPASDVTRPVSALVRGLGLESRVMHRSFSFERAEAVNDKTREVALTVSSDQPYSRSFGEEILDHSPSSIRMNRLLRGAPLLWNHNPDAHIGRVISATTDGHRMHVRAKFGSSALAREKFTDVQEKILTDASIGYVIYDMREEKRGVFRATDWEIYESSLVSVPADPSVGVSKT
jgi:HK97 family phage prohead protease